MEAVFARQRTALFDTARNGTIRKQVVLALAGNDPDRAKSLWAYIKYRRAFPMTFAEATSPIPLIDPTSGTTVFLPELAAPQIFRNLPAAAGTATAQVQAAACAYIFLTARAERGEVMSMERRGRLTHEMDVDVATGGQGGEVFKDTFNNPITFVRMQAGGFLDAAPYANRNDASLDPLDPLGKLRITTASYTIQVQALAAQAAGVGIFPVDNWTGTFISPGLDKTFGTADDIVGYRVRQGN